MIVVSIGLAGALGALCRYWLSRAVAARWQGPLPIGTLLINLTGAFCLGVLLGAAPSLSLSDQVRLPISAGFLGSYTTFSTFSVETAHLFDSGSALIALLNVAASTVFGLLAALLGLWAGGLLT